MASSINTILEELYSLQRLGIKVGLEHTVQLLDQIGNPHEKLRLIHIAGTNGKGSTCSILTKILIDHGFKVGLYTSPHLKKFNERIQINNCQISDEYIATFFKFFFLKSEKYNNISLRRNLIPPLKKDTRITKITRFPPLGKVRFKNSPIITIIKIKIEFLDIR